MITKKIEKLKKNIDLNLLKLLPKELIIGKDILIGMKYVLMSGGKRIRPILNFIGGLICGLSIKDLKIFACGIEYIHNYSLVHDDLPSMDNDDFRRGLKSCHKIFGEGQAILIGDSFLSTGISFLLFPIKKISFENQIKSVKCILDSIGINGMISGQSEDIKNKLKKNNKEKILNIYKYKTSKLIKASLISAIFLNNNNNNNKKLINDLSVFGESFGLAFQIADDLSDIIDIKNKNKKEKLNFPLLYGLKNSKKILKDEIDNACEHVKNYGKNGNILQFLARSLIKK